MWLEIEVDGSLSLLVFVATRRIIWEPPSIKLNVGEVIYL